MFILELKRKNYQHPYNNFNEEESTLFYNEVYNALEPLGWVVEREEHNGSCMQIKKEKSTLIFTSTRF